MTRTHDALMASDAPAGAGLDEIVRTFPSILESLRTSYQELEERAAKVEGELFEANRELATKVNELDGLRGHLEAVLASLPCGVVVRDAQGRVVDANVAACSILGSTLDELRLSGGHAWLQGEAADGTSAARLGTDGRRRVIASSYSEVHRSDGAFDGSVEILDDRTDRADLQERLHAADKLAALGTMAAGIAHEIRNPLNAVKGFAALIARLPEDSPDLDRIHRWASLIVEGASEADAIIENMLSFGNPRELLLESVDGEDLLSSAIRMAVAEEDGAEVHWRSSAPSFAGDRIKLRQATRNLVANAVAIQPDRSRVEVALRLEADEIVLRVADAGPGVTPELRRKVFDPFFTTRAEGTGLGLPLVSAIAALHGGSVQVASEPSTLGGAEFILRFPFRSSDPSRVPSPPPEL